MTTRFVPVPDLETLPSAPAALAAEARRIHDDSVRYWAAYPTAEFFRRPAPDVWAPADQVRHLTKSMRAITPGFTAPKLFLILRFGISFRSSRTVAALSADSAAALARGARAGAFGPKPLDPAEQNEEGRARIMRYHAEAVDRLASALARWSDASLDRYVLPHPLLGRLTAREMAYFALLHNVHHVQVAERRRLELAEENQMLKGMTVALALLAACGGSAARAPLVAPQERFARIDEVVLADSTDSRPVGKPPMPAYPADMRYKGVEAAFMSLVIIDTAGSIEMPSVTFIPPEPPLSFRKAVCDFYRRLRVVPVKRDAVPRRAVMVMPWVFSLQGGVLDGRQMNTRPIQDALRQRGIRAFVPELDTLPHCP